MIITFANHKGGVGKTTLTLAFAIYLSNRFPNKRILLIDVDPQSNLTASLIGTIPTKNVMDAFYDVVRGSFDDCRVYIWESDVLPGYHIIPSTLDMIKVESQLTTTAFKPTELLRPIIQSAKQHYDFILIDTPPSLGLWTRNALMATDHVIVPTLFDNISLYGLNDILLQISLARQNRGAYPKLAGIIGNRLDLRYKVHHRNYQVLKKNMGEKFVEPPIPTSSRTTGSAKMLYNAIVKGDRARLRRSLLAVFDAIYQRMESEASENEHKEEKEEIAVREN
mgnify:CR=1 FL=1